jgi:hypothetical protein
MGKLQRYFLTGLLTLLPIWLVWVVFKFVFAALSGLSQPLIGPLLARIAAGDPALFGWLSGSWVQTALALFVTRRLHRRRRRAGAARGRADAAALVRGGNRAHPAGEDRVRQRAPAARPVADQARTACSASC